MKDDLSFAPVCKANCPPGTGCALRNTNNITWADLRKHCPKLNTLHNKTTAKLRK